MMKKYDKRTIFIIDGSSIVYRAFHAIPPFTTSKGLPTNAVYGFTQSLRKILNDFSPEFIGIAFDVKGPSFRHELFNDYKAQRPAMPDTLSIQIPYIKRLVKAFNIPVIERQGYEADDIIATLVKRFAGADTKVAVVTGDKDMYQLVDDNTVILDYMTEKEYRANDVEEKFGVPPALIRDLMALAGDSIDNIPGVPGVGFKTASKLLKQFGSFEAIFERVDEVKGEKLKENLRNFREQAVLSRELATLHPEVDFACGLDELRYSGPDYASLEPLLIELEFRKILKEVVPEAPPVVVPEGAFRLLTDMGAIKEAVKGLLESERAAAYFLMTEEAASGRLLGVSISIKSGEAFHIPVGEIAEKEVLEPLKPFLESVSVRKDTANSKALYLCAMRAGIEAKGVRVDTSIASYLLNPSKPEHTVEALAHELLGRHIEELKDPRDSEKAFNLSCLKATSLFELGEPLFVRMEEEGLLKLYQDIELPLAQVLASMELRGIKADAQALRELSKSTEVDLARMEGEIYAAAGMEFNINSPKQLAEVLFEKLRLKPVKKTKTGFSTDEEVLTQLASQHDVPRLIIGFRQLSKFKSTYVDALLSLINPATGRVHTSFNQTVTATGRLSSSRPNLQNIPVRGELASKIRKCFIAEDGFTFVSADYSQIELRLVAHMSKDPVLVDAFRKGEDIHTRTACEVFGIMPELVTSEMRRRAKAINFGIIYGMGPYGLSTELGISMKEALDYINRYFARYGKVKEFIDTTVEEALEKGFTTTLFGRRRFIPELKSPVESTVRFGQRLAINTPIQGTAADMIKFAMVRLWRRLRDSSSGARMILQIHDELILEAPIGEAGRIKDLVKDVMEGVVQLLVPVEVNMKTGQSWDVVE